MEKTPFFLVHQATMLALLLTTAVLGDICLSEPKRVECGFPGITPQECNTKGCCFDNSVEGHWCSKSPQSCESRAATCNGHGDCASHPGTSQPDSCTCDAGYTGGTCSKHGTPPPPPPPPPAPSNYTKIKVVHVINSCHLDIGFADSSVGIINRYFDHHFPTAIAVGQGLRNTPVGKLNFMFQSWVVSM
jgi:hypothetical protein